METLRSLQANQNVSSKIHIKSEPLEHPSETGHPTQQSSTNDESSEDVFKIAARAEKLLQDLLQGNNKLNAAALNTAAHVKSEPMQPLLTTSQPPPSLHHPPPPQPQQQQIMFAPNMMPNPYFMPNLMATPGQPGGQMHQMHFPNHHHHHQHQIPVPHSNHLVANVAPPPSSQFVFPPPGSDAAAKNPAFFVSHPPPLPPTGNMVSAPPAGSPMLLPNGISQPPFYYPIQQQAPQLTSPTFFHSQPPFSPYHHHHTQSLPPHLAHTLPPPPPHPMQLQSQFPFGPYMTATANPMCGLSAANGGHHPSPSTSVLNQFVNGQRKRKFGENNNYNNNNTFARFKAPYGGQANNGAVNGYQSKPYKSSYPGAGGKAGGRHDDSDSGLDRCSIDGSTSSSATLGSSFMSQHGGAGLGEEEEDLNIMRERELKDLKCKSVVEKMSVFLKYYQQFKEAYIQRVQSIECSDSLKIQFNSLIKYLNDYESCLAELDMMITEHERVQCKNNHRKTKRLFNKTKTFIRYECNKRLQSYIFEYRRLINSQDRYAGMYDLLDMNNYLISLLPDIGISMRRYINRCEKARQEAEEEQLEEEDAYAAGWNSDNSNDSGAEESGSSFPTDASDIKIPSYKDFVASNGDSFGLNSLEKENKKKQRSASNGGADEDDDDDDDEEDDDDDDDDDEEASIEGGGESSSVAHEKSSSHTHGSDRKLRGYESFSKGVDTLNKYLLKRVEEEESLDELVKERIIKWINKRQSKYILIFSEVDRLLNQHKAGECHQKFHSYLMFNLGKLVTVCDSYHQKLKELLYSTTIRRKKKRKRVKLLPEAMADVFNEIMDLKRCLESTKLQIKRCNEHIKSTAINTTTTATATSTSAVSPSPSSDTI